MPGLATVSGGPQFPPSNGGAASERPPGGWADPQRRGGRAPGAASRTRSPVVATPAPMCAPAANVSQSPTARAFTQNQCNTGHRAPPASPRSGASQARTGARLIVGVEGKFGARLPCHRQRTSERLASGAVRASPAGRSGRGRLSPPTPPLTMAASRHGPCPGTRRRARDASYKVPMIKRPPATKSKPEPRGEADDDVTSFLNRGAPVPGVQRQAGTPQTGFPVSEGTGTAGPPHAGGPTRRLQQVGGEMGFKKGENTHFPPTF